VSLHEFVSTIETQIWDIFFSCKVPGFCDRTIGALFGFTEIDQLWTGQEFEYAVEGVMGQDVATRARFALFFKALLSAVDDGRAKKAADIRDSRGSAQPAEILDSKVPVWQEIESNATARFGVALMRWFLISLEERIGLHRFRFVWHLRGGGSLLSG
jgi:hypothetical protein